jgi:hypothetical protein
MNTVDLVFALMLMAAPLILNLWATRLVVRDDLSEWWQKVAQLLLVWLLPVIGAILVLIVHRKEEKSPLGYREPPDPGDDYGASGRGVGKMREAFDGND